MQNRLLTHAGYVLERGEINQCGGLDISFLISALKQPLNIFLMVGTIVLFVVMYILIMHSKPSIMSIRALVKRASNYQKFVPLILRISLGTALLGASGLGIVISPLSNSFGFPLLQAILGFFLIVGFLLTPTTIATAGLFLYALFKDFHTLGNFDFLGILVALFLLMESKPGVDHLLKIPALQIPKALTRYYPLAIRIGIGVAMMFSAAYEKFLNPHLSKLVVEKFHLTSYIPVSEAMWVLSVGLIEFVLGLFLLLGFKTRLFSAIALFVLTLTLFFFREAVFAHATLFGTLFALFIIGNKKKKKLYH